jgi:hypothetical protein
VSSPCPWAAGGARVVVLDERMKNEEGGRSSHALTKMRRVRTGGVVRSGYRAPGCTLD